MSEALHERIAAEVRAEMGRARINGSQLARLLKRSHTYVWRRLSGEVAFDVAELEEVAVALGIPVEQLLSAKTERVA
jgi:transcriptional regulator with XRE-family HTH domain